MSRSTTRNFIASIVVLVCALGVLASLYIVIGTKETQLKEQLATIKTQNDREQTAFRLEKIAKESEGDRQVPENYFLQQAGESISFLTEVEALAPQNGVVLKTDALEEGSDKKTKDTWVDATFTFSGTRENVERFIALLENLPYVSQINSVQLVAKTEGVWEAKEITRFAVLRHKN